jgi:hypothetical protein
MENFEKYKENESVMMIHSSPTTSNNRWFTVTLITLKNAREAVFSIDLF